jgi:ribosome-associated protein
MDERPVATTLSAMSEEHQEYPKAVVVSETPIELCQFLKFGGLAGSGGQAKQAITEGLVLLNDAVETRKRKKLVLGDRVTFDGKTIVVSS